jgi:hypothetical protein
MSQSDDPRQTSLDALNEKRATGSEFLGRPSIQETANSAARDETLAV